MTLFRSTLPLIFYHAARCLLVSQMKNLHCGAIGVTGELVFLSGSVCGMFRCTDVYLIS